ncbi:MAG TPA: hypothetical protein VNR59_00595 [Gaiellaceae bacterium]|jgi:hypothetical protein|nr:hypothetical protein [Gaiellaceae bacterium]
MIKTDQVAGVRLPDSGVAMETQAATLVAEPWRWARPRVLIEHPDETAGLELASALRLEGYAVAVCPGPHERKQCPLTGSDDCAVARDADIVVSCLGFERDAALDVVRALRLRCPEVPLVLEVPVAAIGPPREIADGCFAVEAPATPELVLAAVRDALAPSGHGENRDA